MARVISQCPRLRLDFEVLKSDGDVIITSVDPLPSICPSFPGILLSISHLYFFFPFPPGLCNRARADKMVVQLDNFTPDQKRVYVIATCTIGLVLSNVTFALRVWAKLITIKKVHLEDWVMLVGLLLSYAVAVCMFYGMHSCAFHNHGDRIDQMIRTYGWSRPASTRCLRCRCDKIPSGITPFFPSVQRCSIANMVYSLSGLSR